MPTALAFAVITKDKAQPKDYQLGLCSVPLTTVEPE